MRIAPVADVKAHFSNYLEQCRDELVVVTKNGRATAVLVPVFEDDDLERLVLAHTPRFRRLLDAADQRIRETGGVKHEDFWQAVEATG